jgi:GNAT superfamily N-acetyltransferase
MKQRVFVTWAAVVAGLATLAISIAFALLPEASAAIRACGGHMPSLVRFQLALSVADVLEALGPAGACREAAIVAMDAVNRLDLHAYIATYGAFVLLSLFVVMKEARLKGYGLVALIVIAALIADVYETSRQLAITADLEHAERHMSVLTVASRAKFIGLTLAALAASWAGWKARPRRMVLAVSCLPALFLMPLALLAPKSFGDLGTLTLAVAWLALLGSVLRLALRRRAGVLVQ